MLYQPFSHTGLPVIFLLLFATGLLEAQPLFPVKKDKKWGLMNAAGRIVQQPVYDAIGEFKEFGYAIMQRSGKVGLLDATGREIVPPRYRDLKTLDSTLISVMETDQWQVVNLQGEVILPSGFERVEVLRRSQGSVSSSQSSVGSGEPFTAHRTPATAYLAFMSGKKWGIVDAAGRLLAAPKYDEVSLHSRSEAGETFIQTRLDGQAGLLLSNGFEVLAPQAEEIVAYTYNLFFYRRFFKWGAVDRTGKPLLEPAFDHFSPLSGSFIKLMSGNKAALFSLVYNTLIYNGEHDAYYLFSNEYVICKKQRLLGLADHCGQQVLAARYNEIQPYNGDFFRANLNGHWGIVTPGDQTVVPFEHDYIAPMRQGLCVVLQNRKSGIANSRGELTVPPSYDRIELEENQARGWQGEQLTIFNFDTEGRLLAESNLGRHFTIKITRENENLAHAGSENSPYQLEKFEWFYSPQHDRWGLRRLDNGAVQIEPAFSEVAVQQDLGLTVVGVETMHQLAFDRTAYRFEMAYGLVQNDTGLLVHEPDLTDIRLHDFDRGLPVARCIFSNGKHGLLNRIGKVVCKDFAYIGDFSDGLAASSVKGKISARLQAPLPHLGSLQAYLNSHLAPFTLTDYTQHDLDLDRSGQLTCEDCAWGYLDTAGQMAVAPQFSFAKMFINEVGIVANGEKWGMVNRRGKQLLPCRYDELGFLENTGNRVLRIFKKEEKYGLIDTLGRLAVNVQYEEIGSFSEGRLAVKRNGQWGFVERNGREVIPCRFEEAGVFSEGLAAVRLDGKWGYIDKNGSVELDFQFSKAGLFSNGLAPAKREGPHFGYINRRGGWVIKPQFPRAHPFDRGVARVEEMTGQYWRTGLIDTLGGTVAKPRFVSLTPFDQHGLAVAGLGGSPEKFTFVNLKGAIISSQSFRSIEPFSEGLARVQWKEGYGFADTTGRLVIEAKFSRASDFSEGKAAVWVDGRCGFIDTKGAYVVEPQFSKCMDFRDGKAIVFKGNQRAGLIDASVNLVIEPGINRLLDFADGRGLVRDEHYQFYYITEQARFYDGFYEKAGQFRHGVAVVQVEGRWAIINQQGIEIIPPKYDKIEQFENGFAKVRIQGFSGLTNLQGELIVQPDYEYISYAGEGLFRVEQGDKVGYFDMKGKWVWGLQE